MMKFQWESWVSKKNDYFRKTMIMFEKKWLFSIWYHQIGTPQPFISDFGASPRSQFYQESCKLTLASVKKRVQTEVMLVNIKKPTIFYRKPTEMRKSWGVRAVLVCVCGFYFSPRFPTYASSFEICNTAHTYLTTYFLASHLDSRLKFETAGR